MRVKKKKKSGCRCYLRDKNGAFYPDARQYNSISFIIQLLILCHSPTWVCFCCGLLTVPESRAGWASEGPPLSGVLVSHFSASSPVAHQCHQQSVLKD